MQRREDHPAATFFFKDIGKRRLKKDKDMAGDAVVHPAAGHRCHTQEEQHHKGQQGDAKPVSQFGQMRNQRHLAPFGFLASCGFSIFAHDVSALVSADASEALFPAVFVGFSVSCAGVSAVASARS